MTLRTPLSRITGKTIVALAATLVLLSGCQRFSYAPATGDDTSDLTFTSEGIAAQPLICVPGKGFMPTEYAIASHDSSSTQLNDLLKAMKKQTAVTTQISTERSLRIGVIYNDGERGASRDRCRIAVQFVPQAEHDYQAHFVMEGEQCGLTLSSDTDTDVTAVVSDWTCP